MQRLGVDRTSPCHMVTGIQGNMQQKTSWSGAFEGGVFGQIRNETRRNLQRVYENLALTCLLTAMAAYMYVNGQLPEPNFLAGILISASLMILAWTRSTPASVVGSNRLIRHGALYTLGFAQGWVISPLIHQVLRFHPESVLVAALGSAGIFGSFTMSALSASRRHYMYLGGILGSVMTVLVLLSLSIIFLNLQSSWLTSIELYVGLFVFSFYVIFDTQLIVERLEQSSTSDIVGHAVSLYMDLMVIFVRLLIILARQREQKQQERKRRK